MFSENKFLKRMKNRNALPLDKDYQDYSAFINLNLKSAKVISEIKESKPTVDVYVDQHESL